MPDPTRPAIAPASAATDDASGVHLLLVNPTRKYALVGGDLLSTGQTGSQGKLLEIRSNEVLVQSENGRETLSMSPGVVVKRPAQPLVTKTGDRPKTINIGNKP
jgi:hypothetical protein